jgi:hypothetical protein
MAGMQTIFQMLRESRFDDVIPIVSQTLRDAASESPQRLTEVAREIVRWQGIFKNTAQARTSETYFRTVHALLQELTGPDSAPAMAATENLAGLLGAIGNLEEAIQLREKVLTYLLSRFPKDDQRVMIVRDGLAILYRRAGRDEKAGELYGDTALCEHLKPVENYLRTNGIPVFSSNRPWSANCHIWVYFDALLDCQSLIDGLHLDSCIQIHDHRGTHDGSERGIVCTIHNDGIMGRHPSDASPLTRTVSGLGNNQ